MTLIPLLLRVLALGIPLACIASTQAAGDSEKRFGRILLFTPEGTELPANYQERLSAIAIRTEAFFKAGIEERGWKVERSEIFARTPSGEIEVIVARDKLPSEATGRNALPAITERALAAGQKAVGRELAEGSVWWTFYHCPKQEVRGFRGMGTRDSGRAINRYPDGPGSVGPNVPIAAKAMWELNLKGCIHEFGHALGLPHIGPKPIENRGNTLMGPINKAFANKSPNKQKEPEIYLSVASAAMLAKHPIFSRNASLNKAKPIPISVSNLSITENKNHSISISGSVSGKAKAHSIVVLDSSKGFGDYWSRPYAAKINKNGEFALTLDNPWDATKGELTLYLCLEDGRNTATGKRESLQKDVISIPYTGKLGNRAFDLNAKK